MNNISNKSVDFANKTLPNIHKNVKKKHSEFLTKFGDAPSIISVNNQLKLTRLKAKFESILKIFIEEKVISDYERMELDGVEYFILEKDNMPKRVHIVIALDSIIIADQSLYSIVGIETSIKEIFQIPHGKENIEDFDWEEFSNNLLNIIHSLIYNSKESLDYIL